VKVQSDYVNPNPNDRAQPALTITGQVAGLNVHDSHKPTNGYFLATDATDLEFSDLDGGPECLGPIAQTEMISP
jgi:hypothetical protein